VMIAKLADVVSVYVPGKRPAWKVEVAEGMDLSLVSAASSSARCQQWLRVV
jgi:hypothetical protein